MDADDLEHAHPAVGDERSPTAAVLGGYLVQKHLSGGHLESILSAKQPPPVPLVLIVALKHTVLPGVVAVYLKQPLPLVLNLSQRDER